MHAPSAFPWRRSVAIPALTGTMAALLAAAPTPAQTPEPAAQTSYHAPMHGPRPLRWEPFAPVPGAHWAIVAGDPDAPGVPGALID